MNKLFLVMLLAILVVVATYEYQRTGSSVPGEQDSVLENDASSSSGKSNNIPRPKLLFEDGSAASQDTVGPEELRSMGWELEQWARGDSRIRIATTVIEGRQQDMLRIFVIRTDDRRTKVNMRVYRTIGKDTYELLMIPQTTNLVTQAVASLEENQDMGDRQRLAFSMDRNGFVMGDMELLNEAIARSPTVTVVGYLVKTDETKKESPNEIKASLQEPQPLTRLEYEIPGWGSVLKALDVASN